MMNEQVGRYMRIAFSRIWLLLVLAVASAGIVWFAGGRELEMKYEGRMKMIVTLSEARSGSISVFDSIRSSQMAVGDISQIVSSDMVLAGVEKECGVDRLTIGRELTINAIPNTRILDIGIERNSPEAAVKLLESLDKNLRIRLKEIDASISYKMLSKPFAGPVPVNQAYPFLFAIAAAFGGALLGAVINLASGGRNLPETGLNQIRGLFEGENILLVPAAKLPKQEGGAV